MERIFFDGSEIDLPKDITKEVDTFKFIISKDTWDQHFSKDEKQHLLSFLPSHENFEKNSEKSKKETLHCLFNGDKFNFENPLNAIFKKFKDGHYSSQAQSNKHFRSQMMHQKYQLQQEEYYERLLQQLLLNKQSIFSKLFTQFNNKPAFIDHHYSNINNNKKIKCCKYRTNQKCHSILMEIKETLHQPLEASSDDDDDDDDDNGGDDEDDTLWSVDVVELDKVLVDIQDPHYNTHTDTNTDTKTSARKTKTRAWCGVNKGELINVKEMIRLHQKRKLQRPDLCVDGMSVGDIAVGLGVKKHDIIVMENKAKERKSKRTKRSRFTTLETDVNSPRRKQQRTTKRTIKQNNKTVDESFSVRNGGGGMGRDDNGDEEGDEDLNFSLESEMSFENNNIISDKCFSCFFSLIKHLICKLPGHSSTLHKLKEELRDWQTECTNDDNAWVYEHPDWTILLQPALNFLSGFPFEGHSESMQFTPMIRQDNTNNIAPHTTMSSPETTTIYTWLDTNENFTNTLKLNNNNSNSNKNHKNNTPNKNNTTNKNIHNTSQPCNNVKSTTNEHNLDDLLLVLNYHWMEGRKIRGTTWETDLSTCIPPSLVTTSYVVGPSTEEDKIAFRIQERERFMSPHKSFVYRCHGYDSVVGPVKGIYSKQGSSMKARGHALLVPHRPHCVNILTLVNDCAARLPNGEGTRYDICELMKDSQYICDNITEAQLNAVVSGALDRLHYDKDPSVKYLSGQKMWVYRHRNRTQEDFERMHMVHKVTARAKKLATSKKSTLSQLQKAFKKQNDARMKFPSASKIAQLSLQQSTNHSQLLITPPTFHPPINHSSINHPSINHTPTIHTPINHASINHTPINQPQSNNIINHSNSNIQKPFNTHTHERSNGISNTLSNNAPSICSPINNNLAPCHSYNPQMTSNNQPTNPLQSIQSPLLNRPQQSHSLMQLNQLQHNQQPQQTLKQQPTHLKQQPKLQQKQLKQKN